MHALNNNKWNCKKRKKTNKKHLSGRLVKFQHKDSSPEQYRQGMWNSGFRPHMNCISDVPFPQEGNMILDKKNVLAETIPTGMPSQGSLPAELPQLQQVCRSLLKGHLGSASDPTHHLPFSSLRAGILFNVKNCSIQCPSITDFRFQDYNRV